MLHIYLILLYILVAPLDLHPSLLETRIGDHVLVRLMASGGMAAVFEAEHVVTGEQVAIKVLARDLRNRKDPLARILQEGRIICSLLHEHVVRVFDYGTAGEGVGFVVMEKLAGRDLATLLESEGALVPSRAVFIARQVCSGLQAAHARGVFHRDIKPGNIFLCDKQRHRDFVKLLDFGIAKLDADDPAKLAATATGVTLGTPQYMSPEQARAAKIDARSDIYQLGLALYEMLVGDPPFDDRNPVKLMGMHLSQRPKPPRQRRPQVSEDLQAIVLKCLEKRPDDRFQSARELRGALDRVVGRDTAGDALSTMVPDVAGTDERAVVGDLRLPTLGSPADLERYARNLSQVTDHLWPRGDVPEELRVIQGAIWTLTEQQMRTGTDLAVARDEADTLARGLEDRLRPLERAIAALEAERSGRAKATEKARDREARLLLLARTLDAEYARIYDEIEAEQATLYQTAAVGGGPVDFRDLFRADIAAQLDQLEVIYRRRSDEAEALSDVRREIACALRETADVDQQLFELKRSRLSLEAQRAGALATQEFEVTDLDNRHRGLERALEHRYLQLGLAFRRAVSALLADRR